MTTSQLARAINADFSGSDVLFSGVSKDSRNIHPGDLYVALKGERFDGHRFLAEVAEAGAAAALVSEPQALELPQVQVADTREALGRMAAHWTRQWREKTGGKMIGITGSNGKTTVKEMCRKILVDASSDDAVLSTKGNLNNEIGLPMTLLELREQHRYAVIEMGASHVGDIEYLTRIARPDVAVLNNAGSAHLEGFGSLQNIAKGKAEIYNGLNEKGVAVINEDDAFAGYWHAYCEKHTRARKIIGFSMRDENADVYARAVEGAAYRLVADGREAPLQLQVPGRHNVMNALAAAAATLSLGIELSSIAASLSSFENIAGRLSIKTAANGCKVVDDSYNANPLSVAAAIEVLAGMSDDSVLVLGDMAELGEEAPALHAEVGRQAESAGIKTLFATGKFGRYTVDAFREAGGDNGFYFERKNDLIEALKEKLTGSEVVLVKGSRSAAMEEVVERILARNNKNKRVT